MFLDIVGIDLYGLAAIVLKIICRTSQGAHWCESNGEVTWGTKESMLRMKEFMWLIHAAANLQVNT